MKRKTQKIVTGSIIALLAFTSLALIGKVTNDKYSWIDKIQDKFTNKEETKTSSDSVNMSIKNNGITLKMLQKTKNELGQEVQTLSYSITPSNATDKSIQVSASYVDNTSCEDVLKVTSNQSEQTISITCLKDFGKVIKVKLVSVSNPNASAEITIDYTKQLKSITTDYKQFVINNESNNVVINLAELYTPIYSSYTKEKNYTFDIVSYGATVEESTFNDNYSFLDKLATNIDESINNNSALPTASDIWNFDTSNAYHSWLVELSNQSDLYVNYEVNYEVKSVENPNIGTRICFDVRYDVGTFDYSSKVVNVDSISVEKTEICFGESAEESTTTKQVVGTWTENWVTSDGAVIISKNTLADNSTAYQILDCQASGFTSTFDENVTSIQLFRCKSGTTIDYLINNFKADPIFNCTNVVTLDSTNNEVSFTWYDYN